MGRNEVKVQHEPDNDNDESKSERTSRLRTWFHKREEEKSRQQTPPCTVGTAKAGVASSGKQTSLWDQAYDSLKAKEPRLVDKYERLLSKELYGDGT